MDQTFPNDALPPEGLYESRESVLTAINSWAKPRGYAFTTGKSLKTANGRIRVIFACDRNKLPPSASINRVRRTSSRRTGCKFSVLAKQSLDRKTWVLSHRPDQECATHNHPPSEDPSAHPAHRRFDEQDATTISNLAVSGTNPQDIRTYLHNHSDTLATQRDIYNRIATTRRDLREGQSSIHALVDQLHKEGFWCRVRLDSDNRLTAIFFAHPDSIAYLQRNSDVLLLDCTYKTNKHHMPLLDIVGVDSCQRSFCIAFAFLSGESEEDYSWALEHLRSLYQHELPSVILTDRCLAAMNAAAIWFSSSKALLCLWHVNKAILQYCRPFFITKHDQALDPSGDKLWDEFYAFWHSVVASPDEETFEDRLAKFELKYNEEYSEPMGYIKMYWLEPHKEMIVKAWVDVHLHFGNVATSRAEGIHSLIKSHIKQSTFDLFDVWQAIKHAITNQLKELIHMRASQQLRIPLDISGVLFEAVRGWVSHYALRKVQEQRKLLQKPNRPPCSQTFTSSYGLPCSHALKQLEEEKQNLLLQHFHSHWHLKRDIAQPQPVLEPVRVVDRIQRRQTQPVTSTRREPSAFEITGNGRRAPATCSVCHAVGHKMNSKACPLRFQKVPRSVVQVPATVPAPNSELFRAIAPAPMVSDMAESEPVIQQATLPTGIPELPYITPNEDPLPLSPSAMPGYAGRAISRAISEEHVIEEAPALVSGQIELPTSYDSPGAIHTRYIAARSAWYAMQPAGSIKTNQQYHAVPTYW